jgi:hypothetical protein
MKNYCHIRFYPILIFLVFIFQNTLFAQNCANNVLNNPGFEFDLNNWTGTGGVIATAPNVVSGTKSLKLCNIGEIKRQTKMAIAGKTYQLRFTAKTAGINQNVLFGLKFLSSSWQVLATEYSSFDSPTGFSSNSIQKLAPTGTAWVEVSITKENAGCVYVDDMCLTDFVQVPLSPCFTEKQLNAQNIVSFDETANGFSVVTQYLSTFFKNEFDKEGNFLSQSLVPYDLPVLSTQTSISATNTQGVVLFLTGKIYNLPNNEKIVAVPLISSNPSEIQTTIYRISSSGTIIVSGSLDGSLVRFLVNPFDPNRFLFKTEETITNSAGVNVVNYEFEELLTLNSQAGKSFKYFSKLSTPTGLQTDIVYRRFLSNGNVLTYQYTKKFNSATGNTTITNNEVIVQNVNTTIWQNQLPDNFEPFKQFHLFEKPNNKVLGVGLLIPDNPQSPDPHGNLWIYNCIDLNADCAYGLVGHYTFDGDATDKSGKQNHGIVNGATLTTDRNGVVNKAYNFDGSDFIEIPNSASLSSPNNQITIAGWVLNQNPNAGFAMLCKSDLGFMDYRLQYYGNGRNELELLLDGGVVGLNYVFPIGEWFHVAVTGNAGVYKFYKDGLIIGTKTEIPNIVAINKVTNLYLGFDPHNAPEYHLGKLDEIRIYDCALTDAEILAIYNTEKPVPVSTCVNNLLQNAGFEFDLNNWSGSGGTIATAPNVASGSKSLKLCNIGESKLQLLPATPGKTYKLQYTAKTAGTSQNVLFGIKFLSASWQPLATEYSSFDSPTGFSSNFIQKTAPTGTAWVEVSINKQNAGCVYVDDLCLTDGATTQGVLSVICPSDIVVSQCFTNGGQGSFGNFVTLERPTATSTCPGNVTIAFDSYTTLSGSMAVTTSNGLVAFGFGSVEVKFKITDACGNQQFCTYKITNTEINPNPQVICPQNITVTASAGQNNAVVNYVTPSATGPCYLYAPILVTGNLASGSLFPIGTTNVNWGLYFGGPTGTLGSVPCTFTVTVNPSQSTGCVGNLLQNPGFESDLNNWSGTGGNIATAPNVATGSKSLKLCNIGENRQQLLPALAGKTYKLQYTVKTAGTNQNVLFGIKFLSASWQPLATEYSSFDSPTGFSSNFIQKTAPTGAVWVEISITKQNAGCVYVDDLCLTSDNGSPNPMPDLTVTDLFVDVATDFYSIAIANIGNGDAIATAPNTVINKKIYFSTDAIWSSNDLLGFSSGAGFIGAGTISVGSSGSFLDFIGNNPNGTYYLIAVIDSENIIVESDETNNYKATAFQLSNGNTNGADLEIKMTADKTTVALWNEVTYTITAKNNGSTTISSAVVQIGGCANGTILGFNNNSSKLVYTGIPNAPTVGTYDYIPQVWTINNLAAGQQGILTLKLFLTSAGEKKVIAFATSQSPNDIDSQPNISPPFDCESAQDDEAHWTINQGQQSLVTGVRAEDLPTSETLTNLNDYDLFPNPAGEMVYIKLTTPTNDKATQNQPITKVTLLNQLGKVEKVQEFSTVNEEEIQEFSLQDVSNGVYFMQFETAVKRAVVRKLVVSRMY